MRWDCRVKGDLLAVRGTLAGAAKQEHYEIASYTTLVQMAKAKRVEGIAKELGKQAKAMMKEQVAAPGDF